MLEQGGFLLPDTAQAVTSILVFENQIASTQPHFGLIWD
jgi:hypothetical protein